MAKRMLIDAAHSEETRIVVLSGNRLDQYDFETSTKKQLKGNIYLAKVTRVEPSLQAAFVDYGGSRQGFLSFNEIHPDYYQIPIADREALAAQARKEEARGAAADADDPAAADGEDGDGREVEVVSGDEVEEIKERHVQQSRRYKIQEVVKRRQILLVQVVKEERGTKGAALTTYLSLAGRYCVLMPNTARGGGISRKIINPDDRKRLRAIASDLPLSDGMGVILRTAGMERSKAEIKRDFTYLIKLWANIREHTLASLAPALIHEEANLINRSLRDLYAKEIEDVLVEGDEGYRMAKEFMRLLIPSHARRIKAYSDSIPLFQRFQVESQLDAMHSPIVHLKSGGYIVISPTEALVAIDVNSGRATRERNIEETATKTNLEAADEIARQLRLRDLSGLIVIDFIDMEVSRNLRTVERRIKDAMKDDRARIQMGRISHFGLMELSRQRLRPSLLEASSQVCAYCGGTGHVRSTESTALHVLRAIEEEGILGRSSEITVYVPGAVALYILNQKRAALGEIERRYGFTVVLANDDSLIPPDYRLDRIKALPGAGEGDHTAEADGEKSARKPRRQRSRDYRGEDAEVQPGAVDDGDDAMEAPAAAAVEADEDEDTETPPVAAKAGDGEDDGARKRRRRGKRGGRRRRRGADDQAPAEASPEGARDEPVADPAAPPAEELSVDAAATPADHGAEAAPADAGEAPEAAHMDHRAEAAPADAGEAPEAAAAKPPRGRRKAAGDDAADAGPAKPRRARRARSKPVNDEPAAAAPEADVAPNAQATPGAPTKPEAPSEPEAATGPDDGGNGAPPTDGPPADDDGAAATPLDPSPRRGWWQRLTR